MKNIVICGLSSRALSMFIKPLMERFSAHYQITGLLDADPKRFAVCKKKFPELSRVPEFNEDAFDEMMRVSKPDIVIVTGRDDTHVTYILRSLQWDTDVITEKPMVTTVQDANRVLGAEAKSKGKVIVAFNYRYSPFHRKIKEMILDGKIGRVTSVDLNWYIDTYHGASYFKRWNRSRPFSGGLSVHKSTHHFDLVNWWLGQNPAEVFAYGALNYYGPDSEWNPLPEEDGRFCGTCRVKEKCHYYSRWHPRSSTASVKDDHLQAGDQSSLYTAYRPDACIFDEEIDIEDTYVAAVKYDGGAFLSYSIIFSAPYEGYRLTINGTKGRIESNEFHEPSRIPFAFPEQTIEYYPLFESKQTIQVVKNEGGHGGGDPLLLEDLFLGKDPLRRYDILAGAEAGAYSIAVGEGMWRSVAEKKPINIKRLFQMQNA
ncbi:Gfo/Idh/MocA family oxidoreductase [Bacillus inaquosorum]|uniref:Gfo/Idh/MocA family oxidoreductase n=1 Tax=Bacillus inaquosorum TaxID=483913 RepID=UPI002282FDD4|nr:Gfo/Idh/MocA family oxidoreductase [Bacillus inaquosorum]MCY8795466.1 Gfo/Idh/MocA family oxidoreductase [Bacillus inaquosorum]MEC0772542.1 Gfo/Idh/MocA family oxidoreductase [Bacillus inaquosorum]MEC0798073.1 Gfo/Idh/MocA family oxidoreductase [Bacillus inaquosorum]